MRHVIVIEDNQIIGSLMADLALEYGASSVAIAVNEEEAVALARSHKPHLIVSDVDLCEGGRGPMAVMRIHAELGSIPAIFVTREPDDNDARRLGITLSKPITGTQFGIAFTRASDAALRPQVNAT